ncbi:UNVERIFIED_CONTAM: hypothetical protein RMT77_006003 [Armadillidium vulgare]
MWPMNNISALQAGAPNFIVLRGGRGGRSRGGRNYQKRKEGNFAGRKPYHNWKKKERVVTPELIDAKKIFVHSLPVHINEEALRNFMSKYGKVVETKIIKKVGVKSKPYAFVTLESEEATQKILSLTEEECKIDGYSFYCKPGRLHFKVPGMIGFQRTQLSEREFDLEPDDPTKVSIHLLIDDVLLRIMDFLPLRDLLRIDAVCRRWQSLVHTSFRSKIPAIMEENLNTWLGKNIINPTLPVISKVLTLSGESLLSLTLTDRESYKGKLLKVVSQLCPALESLTVEMLYIKSIPFLKEFVACYPHLKSFKCRDSEHFSDEDLMFILINLQNLETLGIEGSFACGKFLTKLPDTLKFLELPMCRNLLDEFLPEIYNRCPLLKVLQLGNTECQRRFVCELGSKCQYITELAVSCEQLPNFSNFKNLKNLSYKGASTYSIMALLSSLPTELEVLKLYESIQETENDLVDFSVLKNLKVLYLPQQSWRSLSIQSIKTISLCPKLVSFRYKGTNNHKPAILDIIRRCQDLKELECMGVTLSDEDLNSFAEANKNRVGVLRFTVGMNRSGMNIIEKFNEAKYEVNMFDVDNIFGEGNLTFSDDDDDEDDYDFYDGFMSEEDYDSDHNPFGFDDFDDNDFLYYEDYGLVHPWEMIFDALDSLPGDDNLDRDLDDIFF